MMTELIAALTVTFTFGLLLGVVVAALVSERRRNDVLVAVLQDRPVGGVRRARSAKIPDAEETAYQEIAQRGVDRLTAHIMEEAQVSEHRARAEAEELAAGAERFGGDSWP